MNILASLKLTLGALLLLVVVVVAVYFLQRGSSGLLALPFGLLAVNLLAAIVVNPQFRRQPPLLIFHLALLAIVVLAAVGRLTYLTGHVEVAEGEEFAGELTGFESGPLHSLKRLQALRFTNDGFAIDYEPGLARVGTRNTVTYVGASGIAERSEIGDHKPMILDGYRFYTTHNKGFSPTFAWQPAGAAEPIVGAVNLPSYPVNELRQSRDWNLPGTDTRAWVQLQFDDVILDPAKRSGFRLPNQHVLVLRIGDRRWELQPGDSVDLPQGRLSYQGLRTWMGYTVFYDWTITWMLAASLLALGAMGWHFKVKFAARRWDETTQ